MEVDGLVNILRKKNWFFEQNEQCTVEKGTPKLHILPINRIYRWMLFWYQKYITNMHRFPNFFFSFIYVICQPDGKPILTKPAPLLLFCDWYATNGGEYLMWTLYKLRVDQIFRFCIFCSWVLFLGENRKLWNKILEGENLRISLNFQILGGGHKPPKFSFSGLLVIGH